jgi:hypothetical protein
MVASAKRFECFVPLLPSESQEEFAALALEFEQAFQPKDAVDRRLVCELVCITWDIQRLWPYKTVIINNSRITALRTILQQLLYRKDFDSPDEHEVAAEKFARGWFSNRADKTRVAKLLRRYQMEGEAAIEAEAFRSVAEDLERLDRMLAVCTVRFDRTLRCVMEYQQARSASLQCGADRILNSDDVPRLVNPNSKAGNDKRTES